MVQLLCVAHNGHYDCQEDRQDGNKHGSLTCNFCLVEISIFKYFRLARA